MELRKEMNSEIERTNGPLNDLFTKVTRLEEKKNFAKKNKFKGVYIFASFDLVNSTKIKYRDSNWLRLINELINISSSEWFGLNFWKFNGDEVLYYAEITSLNQIASTLHQIYLKTIYFNDKLLKVISNDKDLGFARDLVGIKTAVWIAYVSNENDVINSKLDNINYIDFAGINMDEGFRMSKCAIQNKIIVDPKITFLICLAAEEIYNRKISTLDKTLSDRIKDLKAPEGIDEVFGKFWLNSAALSSEHEDLFKVVANNFRVIGFEKCKGVWDERPYPIIWYSDNWDMSIKNAKYDEAYQNQCVNQELINAYYKDYEHAYLSTYNILKKIYADVSIFRLVINKILLECNFNLWTASVMDKHIDSRTYLYYSIVYIYKKTNAALVFLRSDDRGHLPHVWDFDQQRNAQTLSSASTIIQIEDRFKKNFGIDIHVVHDQLKNSIIPMDIHPIYRKGKIHNGILCFAYIDEKLPYSEEELLGAIRSKLQNVTSGNGYPLYSDARFVHLSQLNFTEDLLNMSLIIDDKEVTEMTYDEILIDSNSWNSHNKPKFKDEKCTTNFVLTVYDALNYSENQREIKFNDQFRQT